MERDLGGLGESFFKGWCDSVGIVANESKVDRTGWDFYLEISSGRELGVPDFLHASSVECKVQVKSTDSSRRKVQVELSNLHAMATSPLPAFYVFLEFENGSIPVNAFVRHVDEKLISKILSNVHLARNKKPPKKLNSVKMTISVSEKEKLEAPSGYFLRDRLLESIGAYQDYIKRKGEFLERVGYEEGLAVFTFSIEGEVNYSKFLSLSLGGKETWT